MEKLNVYRTKRRRLNGCRRRCWRPRWP